MAKNKYEAINIDTMTGDITITSTKNNALDFVGKTWSSAIDSVSANGNNLVITTKNANHYKVILTDYFAKNGAFPIKYIHTTDTGASDLAILDYVNQNNIAGAAQTITTATKGKYNGTVFNDTITGTDFADKIYGNGGNDTIDGGKQNDTITGGAGTNTILLYTTKSFGQDTVVLTKDEHLKLKLTDATDLSKVNCEIKNKDLVVTVNKGLPNLESSVTIKNYTKKDVLTSTGSLQIVGSNDSVLYDLREDFYLTTYMDSAEGHYNKSSFTGSWINDNVNAENYVTTIQKGKTSDTTKGVTVNLGDSVNSNEVTGSIYADTIKGGAHADTIRGGKGNDNITGGAGTNTITYYKGDGCDTINLSKDEDLTIDLKDLAFSDVKIEYANKNKDVKIWYADETGAEAGSLTLKNFGAKDLTKSVIIKDKNSHTFNFDTDYITASVDKSNFTGTLHNDEIDASKSDELLKKNKHVNMVLNGAGGNDSIIGSKYADTIKGGNGNDIIEGGKGDDLLYGETGENVFVFNSGDGKDVIYSGKGEDTLKFIGSDNKQALLAFEVADNAKDLIIYYGMDRNSTITVKDYYKKQQLNPACTVKYIQIGEGEKIDIETAKQQSETEFKDIVATGSGTNFDIKSTTQYIIGSDNDDNPDISPTNKSPLYISLGEGNDTINNSGKNSLFEITGGNGNKTITTGSGSDRIAVGNGTHNINAGSGTNTITAGNSTGNSTITTTSGNDTITVGDGGYNINAGDGNDAITTGNGDDTITTNYGEDVINAGAGHNVITTGSGKKIVEVGDSTDSATNIGSEITLGGGNGFSEITTGSGNDTIIFNSGENATIDTGAGDDTITYKYGGNATIKAGEGDNKIYFGDNDTNTFVFNITSGSGNDEIELRNAYGVSSIDAGAGDNTITINNNGTGLELTLTTYEGDDTITSNVNGLEKIYAGDGRNIITTGNGKKIIEVGDSTITDTQDENYNIGSQITLGGSNDESEINAGSGNDEVIIKGNGASTIEVNLGAGDNTVSINNAGIQSSDITALGGDDTFTSEGQLGSYYGSNKNEIDLGDGKNTVTLKNAAYRTTITTGAGDDTITFNSHGRYNEIKAGEGKNIIKYGTDMTGWNNEDGVTITAGAGDDEITIGGFSDQGEGLGSVGGNNINAGAGNNTIKIAYTINSEITTGSGDDTIEIAKNSSDNSTSNTINAGAGANTITLGKGSNNTITTEGDAVQTITLGQEGGKTNSANTITTGGGADKITIIGNNNTIDAGEGENIINITGNNNENITTGDDKDTITADGSYNVIHAGNGKNEITATGAGNAIYTGSDDDTITTGEEGGSNEIYIGTYDEDEEEVTVEGGTNNTVNLGDYSSNKVYIYNTKIEEGKENTINIADGAYSDTIEVLNGHTRITGNGVSDSNVTTGDGNDVISLTGDNNAINAGGGTNNITTGAYQSSVTTGDGNDTITLSTDGSNANINAGGGTNTISSEYQLTSSVITTGDGNDTVTLGKAGEKYVQNNTIALGEGKNTLTIEQNYGSNTITTGAGDDEFYISYSGGDDNIDAGNGNNIIHYGLGLSSSWSSSTNTITTGSGNDEIIVGTFDEEGEELGSVDKMVINAGDGSNTVKIAGRTGYNSVTTTGDEVQNITIGSESYNNEVTTEGGNDVIKLGEKNYSYGNTINAGEGDNVIVIGNQDKEVDNYHTYGNTVTTGDGDDTITLGNNGYTSSYYKNTIKAGDGHNIISVGRGMVSITAGDSTNTETNMGSEITVNTDMGNTSSGSDITTGSGDDIITITGNMGSTTINAGAGDNTIIIINPTEDTEDETKLSLSNTTITTLDGDDEITVGYNSGYVTVNAGNGDNIISVDGSYETINTGSGKDTVTVGSSKLTVGYSTVNIGAYDEDLEEVTTEGGVENTVTIKGGDSNTVNIYNTQTVDEKFNTVNIDGGNGNNTINVLGGHTLIDLGGTNWNKVTTGDGDDIITNAGYGSNINAGDGDNQITITGNGGNVYVTTGDGNDTIDLKSGYEIRSGGGDDTININGENFNPHIYMGAGTDTLNINDDFTAQIYAYFNKGDGHDTITGIHDGMLGLPIAVDPSVDFYVKPNDETKSSMDIVLIEDGVETGDVLTVENVYNEDGTAFNQFILDSYAYTINNIKFEDCYTEASIIEGEGLINGTAGSDIIIGSDNDDTIYPKEGVDVISPKGGDDIIDLEGMSYTKTVHYNKGDGNLTLRNIGGTHVELYMEDATAEDTVIEKHGADMYIIRSNNETLTIKDAYLADGTINKVVSIYEKDGTSYGAIWEYPNNAEKAVEVYDDEGVIVPDAYAHAQNFRVTGDTTTIRTTGLITADWQTNYVIYGTNSINPVTVDLSWCYSSGYVNWNKEDNGDLTMRVMVDTESGDVDTNVVEIKILEFFNEYNSVNTFKFENGGTKDYNHITGLWQFINGTSSSGETLKGTWLKDVIKGLGGNDTIKGEGGNDELWGNGGDDIITGGDGNDTIYGGDGVDQIDGGYGANTIYGGKGNDIIVSSNDSLDNIHFAEGDGNDEVIVMRNGTHYYFDDLTSDKLSYSVNEYNQLVINYGEGTDSVTSSNLQSTRGVTVYTDDMVDGAYATIATSEGYSYAGGDGKDIYLGSASGDTIRGNKGDDEFYSGGGADEYKFKNGDGNDIIRVGGEESDLDFESSAIDEISFSKDDMNLVATYNDGADSVTVENYFAGGGDGLEFSFTTSDDVQHSVASDGGHYIDDSESATVTGDSYFCNYITVNAANTTIEGGNKNNISWSLADGVERTLVLTDESSNVLTFTNWDGLTGMATYVDGDDIIITNGDTINVRIENGFVSQKDMTITDGNVYRTLETCMADSNIYIDSSLDVSGTNDSDSIRVISSDVVEAGGSVVGNEGSDYIVVERDGVDVATNTFASSLAARQDLSDGIMEGVTLYGEDYRVYAQSRFNDIYSLNEDSDDTYYTYFMNSGNNQTTRIEDAGGTDSLVLMNSYSGAVETEDGQYKVSGALNTNLFFRVDPDAYSDFDVEIGTIGNMENAAQGNDHKGIYIKDNCIESITTSDGYTISSTDIAQLAEYAAGWIADQGYASYDQMATEGGADVLKDYVAVINKEADIQGYWVVPTP